MFLSIAGRLSLAVAFFCAVASFAHAEVSVSPSDPIVAAVPKVSPSPGASPSAGPTKAPKRFTIHGDGYLNAINQQMKGEGLKPPEGPAFAAGSVISPNSPYDLFSGAPLGSGFGFHQALNISAVYSLAKNIDLTTLVGYGSVSGNANTAGYWGNQLMPTLNAHLGYRSASLPVSFDTHNGQNPTQASRVSVLSGTLITHDGNSGLRAGYFDLRQTNKFVFQSAPQTNSSAALAPMLPESLGDGAPLMDGMAPFSSTLPLHGIDGFTKIKDATIELSDAELPALPGTHARVRTGSIFIDRGPGTKFSLQYASVNEGGQTIGTTTLFGGSPTVVSSFQGLLPFSTLGAQRQTIIGGSAKFPLPNAFDALIEFSSSTYSADGVASPATANVKGSYTHGQLRRGFGAFEVSLDGYRFDPHYATTILPYGTLENVWSAAFSWPGPWLKGNYQLVDNTAVGVNRQGFRLKGISAFGKTEARVSYAQFDQISPFDSANGFSTGFVEGYYLPQLTASGTTLGHQKQYAAYVAFHPMWGSVTVDFTDDSQHRNASPGNPQEAVSIDYPAYVFTFSRQLNPRLLGALGYARYATNGSFSNTGANNADTDQRVYFIGGQFSKDGKNAYHLQYRYYVNNGLPNIPGAAGPQFYGGQFILEQRFHL